MEKRKRIVFFSNLFPDSQQPYRGLDNATVLHQLAPHYDIRVIAARPTLPLSPWSAPAPRAIDQVFAPTYVPIPYVPKIGSRLNHRLMARALRKTLGSTRKSFDFDLLLASWLYPDGCAAARIAAELEIPSALIAQGTDVHGYLKSRVRRPLILEAVELAAATVTRSKSLADLLADAGSPRDKLFPIHNGADTAVFHPRDKTASRRELGASLDSPLMLFVGNLLPVKNPLMLVDAWASASAQLEAQPKLVMAGQGPLESAIRARAAEYKLSEHLTLTGGIDSNAVARWMGAADLLCLTSHNEGLPNVVIEALACELPVLATDVGGISELVDGKKGGALTGPGDTEAYAAAMIELIADPAGKQAQGDGAAYSWGRCAAEYRQVLETVIHLKHGC